MSYDDYESGFEDALDAGFDDVEELDDDEDYGRAAPLYDDDDYAYDDEGDEESYDYSE